jgi:hypothetical protein
VALQGTIDSFALSDVLRLLHTSTKTGRLIVNGDRGSASLWIIEGELVAGTTSADPHEPDLIDVVFDVLRYGHGSFIFENDAACPNPGTPMPIVPALEQAEAALAEWYEIIRIVPSLDSVVTLAPELPHPEVVVDQACWTSIVAVGGGTTVADLGSMLGLSELPVCRLVRALVSAGFVTVGPAPEFEVAEETSGLDMTAFDVDADAVVEAEPELEAAGVQYTSDSFSGAADTFAPLAETPTEGEMDDVDVPDLAISGLSDDPFAPESFPTSTTSLFDRGAEMGEPVEEDWSQALSMLSPKAAQAVAAASGDDSSDSAFDDGDDERRFLD